MTTAQAKRKKGRPSAGPMISRQIRIPVEHWARIIEIAQEEMTEPASIIRKLLRQGLSARGEAA